MPNIENIEKVKAAIRSEEHAKFGMQWWHMPQEDCGTIACIGGTACLLSGATGPDLNDQLVAQWWLGITYDQSEELFYPSMAMQFFETHIASQDFWPKITADHACKALDLVAQDATPEEIANYWQGVSEELLDA